MMDPVKCFTLHSFFMSFYHQVFAYKVFNETMFDKSICLISCFPVGVFLEITQGIYYHQTNYSYFFPQGFSKELKEHVDLKMDSIKRGSVTILYLISSKQQLPVTIEAMKLMVKALVTPNVKAIVTAMFIAAVREGIEALHLCQ